MDIYEYQAKLPEAIQAIEEVEACSSHDGKAWSHRMTCEGCAHLAVKPIEHLAMAYLHAQLVKPADAVVAAYRLLKAPEANVHDMFRNWDRYLVAHQAGQGPHPQEVRGHRIQKNREASAAFWEALRKLDSKWPKDFQAQVREDKIKEA